MRRIDDPATTWRSRGRDWLRLLAALGLGLLATAVSGCGEGGNGAGDGANEPLLVMAATSLSTAMPVLIDRFEARTGTSVDLALGATGNLAAQIENGAPADLFFAADEVTVTRLVASGSIRPSSVRTYGVGQLVLVWRDEAERPASLQQLAEGRYEVVAIANPEIAPYGSAARESLQQSGVWDAVEPKVVQGETIAQTYQLVQTGNADVALVARSVVDSATTEFIPIDPRLHVPIRQAAGVLERSANPAAQRFLTYVLGSEGQAILSEHGLGSPR